MVRAKARMALSGSSFMVSIIDRWSRLGDRANAPHSVRCSSHQRRHPMNVLLGVSGLIFVSAVTPGPNNIAVLRIAGEQGLKATAAAILAVVSGSLALLIVTQAGLGFVAGRPQWARGWVPCGGGG